MTSAILTPWWRTWAPVPPGSPVLGSGAPTRILDYRNARVAGLMDEIRRSTHLDQRTTSIKQTARTGAIGVVVASMPVPKLLALLDDPLVSAALPAEGRYLALMQP